MLFGAEPGPSITLQRLTGEHGFVLCLVQDGQEALAGAPPEATGVYVGCVWQEYALALERLRVAPSVAVLTGSGLNFMVGRVSYTFGLQGAPVQHQALAANLAMSSTFTGHTAFTGFPVTILHTEGIAFPDILRCPVAQSSCST